MRYEKKYLSFIMYLLSILALAFFSFFPEGRSWGVNVWGYFSKPLIISITIISLISGVTLFLWSEKIFNSLMKISFKVTLWCISVIGFSSFILLRCKSYFLGDGYTILSVLSSNNPLMEKKRQLLESYTHIYMYKFLGSNGVNDAILSYQLISFLSGFLFISLTIYSAIKLFEDNSHRILFVLGLLSSGYMLLFYGYVENYSIFSLSILIYCIIGLLILQQKVNKWILIILLPLAISLHVFGVALVPPTLYLIMKGGKIEKLIKQIKNIYLYLIGITFICSIAYIFGYYYQNNYFFQISLVPFYMTRLTQEGYTLFSLKHLSDYFNLLFLLVPGIFILLFNNSSLSLKKFFTNQEYLFLTVFTLSALGITFIFDPKLGMARDWDLFAFCGIPLTFLLYYIAINQIQSSKFRIVNISLSILIGFCVLIPRAYSLTDDEVSIKHFRNYISLDKVKNRNSWILLVNYYKDMGDSTKSDITYNEWKSNFPEEIMMAQANRIFYNDRNIQGTVNLLYKILEINPTYSDAYAFLGMCYIQMKQFDSSITLLRMSDALSPNRAHNIDNLGRAYLNIKDYDNALDCFLQSTYLDSTNFIYSYNLGLLYLKINDYEKYHQQILKSASQPGAVDLVYKELIVSLLNRKEIQQAKQIIASHPTIKNDSLFIKNIINKYQF